MLKTTKLIIIFALLTYACNQKQEKEKVIAQVNNKKLYLSEIQSIIHEGINKKDSAEIVKLYIDQWIEKQLILQEALKILSPSERNLKKQIEEYRNSLLIYLWERKIIEQQMDSTVTAQEIQKYYEQNKYEFILQEDIVRAYYVKVNINAPQQDKLMELLKTENKNELENYCRKYAINFFIDDKTWLYYNEFTKEIPLKPSHYQEITKGNVFLKLNDDLYNYYLKVIDFKLKGTISPLALEENTIKEIIIQKRKHDLLRGKRLNMRREAEKAGKIYTNF